MLENRERLLKMSDKYSKLLKTMVMDLSYNE